MMRRNLTGHFLIVSEDSTLDKQRSKQEQYEDAKDCRRLTIVNDRALIESEGSAALHAYFCAAQDFMDVLRIAGLPKNEQLPAIARRLATVTFPTAWLGFFKDQ